MKLIPLSVPNLNQDIVNNLKECIDTGWVSTGGKYIDLFEEKLANYLHVKKVVGIQSGTEALHMVYKYLDFKDCEVICPTVTFVASINPLLYENGYPIFFDCDDTLNMDLEKVEDFCFYECDVIDGKLINKKTKRWVKGIVVVHVFGNLIDMEKVMDIAETYHLKVVEDACEAVGSYYTSGRYKGKFAGTIGDVGVYSFNANKIITMGGGGAITSQDFDLLETIRHWSIQSKSDALFYKHDCLGYNYRLLNINAAIGVSQLEQLETFIKTKEKNYQLYEKELKKIDGLELKKFNQDTRPNYWFYSVIVDENIFGMNRDQCMNYLQNVNIQTRPLWGLMHEQPHLSEYETYKINKAYYYKKHLLNIPCSTSLTEQEIDIVVDELRYKYLDNSLVSIITPVYNSEKTIRETIESVLNQTYTNFEMICCDDASTDISSEIIKEYREKDERIKYIRLTQNSGAAVARNVALEHAKGRFIAFLDSDDIWEKDKLAVQIEFMKQNKIGFSFTSYQMMDGAGHLFKRIVKAPEVMTYQKLLKNTIIGCLTVVIDKRIIGEFKMPLVRESQDFATWLSILKKGYNAYGINVVLARYRKGSHSLSGNKFKALKNNWMIYRSLERLSFIKTMYVFSFYVANALKKHLLLR